MTGLNGRRNILWSVIRLWRRLDKLNVTTSLQRNNILWLWAISEAFYCQLRLLSWQRNVSVLSDREIWRENSTWSLWNDEVYLMKCGVTIISLTAEEYGYCVWNSFCGLYHFSAEKLSMSRLFYHTANHAIKYHESVARSLLWRECIIFMVIEKFILLFWSYMTLPVREIMSMSRLCCLQ